MSDRYDRLVNVCASVLIVCVWVFLAWLASLAVPDCTWDRALLLIVAFTLAARLPSSRMTE